MSLPSLIIRKQGLGAVAVESLDGMQMARREDIGFPITARRLPNQMATVYRSLDPLTYRLLGQCVHSRRSAALALQYYES